LHDVFLTLFTSRTMAAIAAPRLSPAETIVTTACLATLAAGVAWEMRRPMDDRITMSAPLVALATDSVDASAIRDRDIAFYQERADADAASAIDRATLGALLLSRARATGSERDLVRAERVARESIALRGSRNGQSFELLASILMAQHNFREAHAVAAAADSLAPDTPSHQALLGEIELELGDYEAAASHFRATRFDGQHFTIGARIARWYELTGRAAEARTLLTRATAQAAKRDDLPREQVAWFSFRLGELELRLGNTGAADSAFRRGLTQHPSDVRILGGLARSSLARGSAREAITLGERALAQQVEPTVLGVLSDAWRALGDTAQATQYTKAMSAAVLSQPGSLHRALGLHLLDHGSLADRRAVLRRARQELAARPDVYGHDLLAWALFRAGRGAEARAEMRKALAHGTEDILLQQHANALFDAARGTVAVADGK
jgi:Flp pilus assembly protein TadD